jgi:Methyltransferase domain
MISADEMSADQVFQYLKWSNSSSCRLTHDFGGSVFEYAEVHGIDGQKAVCMDPGIAPNSSSCLIYSFGINDEWSFDLHFEQFGCQVHAFDPSMDMANGNYTANIRYWNIGLASKNTKYAGWKLFTLNFIYDKLKNSHGPEVIDYLKMDIEGNEWNALPQIIDSGMLDNVRQLGVEFHLESDEPVEEYRKRIRIIKQLEERGMVRFASRVNVWMERDVDVLNRTDHVGYEIAWYNQKFYSSV